MSYTHEMSDVQDIKAEMKDIRADVKDVKQALLRMEKVFYAATALTAFAGALVVWCASPWSSESEVSRGTHWLTAAR